MTFAHHSHNLFWLLFLDSWKTENCVYGASHDSGIPNMCLHVVLQIEEAKISKKSHIFAKI